MKSHEADQAASIEKLSLFFLGGEKLRLHSKHFPFKSSNMLNLHSNLRVFGFHFLVHPFFSHKKKPEIPHSLVFFEVMWVLTSGLAQIGWELPYVLWKVPGV